MSVIWSGITKQGAVVPVQVEESGRVVAQGYPGEKGEKGDPGEEGPEGPPGEYSQGDDVLLNDAEFTGHVGIGTDASGNILHVVDNDSQGIRSQSKFAQSTSANKGLHVSNGDLVDTFNVSYTGTGYFAEQVGVGTPIPLSALDVNGDVILKSRNKKWMIVESSGLAHLVEQTSFFELNPQLLPVVDGPTSGSGSLSDFVKVPTHDSASNNLLKGRNETVYPELRDIPGELSLVEQALSEVFEKLRMSPPAGWPVWDGQNEAATDNDNA